MSGIIDAFIKCRDILNSMDVPQDGRWIMIDPSLLKRGVMKLMMRGTYKKRGSEIKWRKH